tara:strand:+ start:1542 stop:1793 length:252 start_codon:yes stop_codon:yes gene_type:complete
VLDLGTGASALLALIASHAGAKSVIGVEANKVGKYDTHISLSTTSCFLPPHFEDRIEEVVPKNISPLFLPSAIYRNLRNMLES